MFTYCPSRAGHRTWQGYLKRWALSWLVYCIITCCLFHVVQLTEDKSVRVCAPVSDRDVICHYSCALNLLCDDKWSALLLNAFVSGLFWENCVAFDRLWNVSFSLVFMLKTDRNNAHHINIVHQHMKRHMIGQFDNEIGLCRVQSIIVNWSLLSIAYLLVSLQFQLPFLQAIARDKHKNKSLYV